MSELLFYEANVIRIFVIGILFGLYLASFAHCLRWLIFQDGGWKIRKKINWIMLGITTYLSLYSTANFLDVIFLNFPFTSQRRIEEILWFHFFQWFDLAASVIMYRSALLIIDGVLIYRCWVVFAKSWRVVCLPLAAWMFCLVGAMVQSYCDIGTRTSYPVEETALCQSSGPLETFYLSNIVTSIFTTSAIVWRVWRVARANITNTSHLYRLCRILAESGILYTLSSIFYLITYFVPANKVTTTVLDGAAGPLAIFMPGIAFNLILIRVGEQRAHSGDDCVVDSKNTKKALPNALRFNPRIETHERASESTNADEEG